MIGLPGDFFFYFILFLFFFGDLFGVKCQLFGGEGFGFVCMCVCLVNF